MHRPSLSRNLIVALFAVVIVLATKAKGDEEPSASSALPTITERTKDLRRTDGFLPFYADTAAGTLLAEFPVSDFEFLYATGLSTGLGSNPVGLDRGQWGDTRLVRFQRVGRRGYLIQQNLNYRATRSDLAERVAVDESFADSVVWSAEIVAESDNSVLVDLETLLLSDAHRVIAKLKATGQGDFSVDRDRSFVELERCRGFPKNTELNAMLTFTSTKPGPLVQETAADGHSFSLRLHHSFVQLPPPGYQPRNADPRVASFSIAFADYSAPLDQPMQTRWIARHRLQKANPELAQSPPVDPIVYYLDPGTPQPVRDALLEGARWWNAAFETAGFMDAFQVRMLPDNVDPMDVRYNVIQWVHRSTRGWSYGQTITDPRTGEIIKGHVLLGSLRVRQDRLIIDGLTATHSPTDTPVCACCGIAGAGFDTALAMFDPAVSPVDVSLARLRQLSAHEVGHTIGFSHNFAASTYADRASVMDYPAPRVNITPDGQLDLHDAYAVGLGEWDTFMVRYAYTEFANDAAEAAGLQQLLQEANTRDLLYLSDADARPAGAANPRANLWDNGTDPVQELNHVLRVRRIALNKLGTDDLLSNQPVSDLEVVLVPIYLYHRYQIDAVVKLIGGFDYDYAMAGQPHTPVKPVPVPQQQAALDALLESLDPRELTIPERLLALLTPRPWSSPADGERFSSRTAMIFDPDSAARVLMEHTLSGILQPQRAARLQAYASDDWNLTHVLDRITSRLLPNDGSDSANRLQRLAQYVFVQQLIRLAGDESTSHAVRSAASHQLTQVAGTLLATQPDDATTRGHQLQLLEEIKRFASRPHSAALPPQPTDPPPGSPIGTPH